MGLGGNLGDPPELILAALNALHAREGVKVVRVSSLYRNPPMDASAQPDYVNAVARLDVSIEPLALLDVFQDIERCAGRVRTGQRWQARTLDLDLLLFGALRLQSSRLTLPHPGAHERAFVIHPLAEIAPGVEIPGHGRARELAAKVNPGALERIAGPPLLAG